MMAMMMMNDGRRVLDPLPLLHWLGRCWRGSAMDQQPPPPVSPARFHSDRPHGEGMAANYRRQWRRRPTGRGGTRENGRRPNVPNPPTVLPCGMQYVRGIPCMGGREESWTYHFLDNRHLAICRWGYF